MVGGLVGKNLSSTISNCYATGGASATAGNYAGGLVGLNTVGVVNDCYSLGGASATGYYGGLMGLSSSDSTTTLCYWNTETSGLSSSSGGTGKTTAEMKTASTYTGWDFTTWALMPQFNDGYPSLAVGGPLLSALSINSGATETSNRTVTLTPTVSGTPTMYRASESSSFSGASWQTYTATPTFQLSSGDGSKKVYFQVYDANGLSGVVSDSIMLDTAVAPSLDSFSINSDAAKTGNRTVTLNNACSAGTPTHFMASESSSFTGAAWKAYSATPSFTLSAAVGTKTVYFKTKNGYGESSVLNDTIEYATPPTVASLKINGGAANATTQTVTLDNTYTGTAPTEYMASESKTSLTLNTAKWQSYTAAPSFTLSAGNGTKTVYFKVRNDYGESAIKSDTVVMAGPVVKAFTLNANAKTTNNRVVTLTKTCTGNPTEYQVSEDAGFAAATWQTYSTKITTMSLSSGDASKTVYFKVRNDKGTESVSKSDSITLNEAVVTAFSINNDATTATMRTVSLNNAKTGNNVVSYRASEKKNFAGAQWNDYTTLGTYTFASTAVNGKKTIYFQVKTQNGQLSDIAQDDINLSLPVLASLKINNGDKSTATANVTLDNVVTGGTPAYYMASESKTSLTLNTATWYAYDKSPTFGLSLGKGTKTVYFKVKNADGVESAIKSDTISKTTVPAGTGKSATESKATESAASKTPKKATLSKALKEDAAKAVEEKGTNLTVDVVTTGTAKANLQITGYEVSDDTVMVGDVVGVALSVTNAGNAAAGKFHVALYLVTDELLAQGVGYLVDDVAVDGLAAQGNTMLEWNFVMPELTGEVYPVFVLDSQSELAPLTEDNVFDADPLLVFPCSGN